MLCLVIRGLLNLYLFSCIYCYFQRQGAKVQTFCKERGVFLCLRLDCNWFILYHSKK